MFPKFGGVRLHPLPFVAADVINRWRYPWWNTVNVCVCVEEYLCVEWMHLHRMLSIIPGRATPVHPHTVSIIMLQEPSPTARFITWTCMLRAKILGVFKPHCSFIHENGFIEANFVYVEECSQVGFGAAWVLWETCRLYLLSYLLRGLSPQANYTDWATAACRRS
jgi:hypothetical protein